MNSGEAYVNLINHIKFAATIDSCAAVLGWDERTQLPKKGAEFRGEQMGVLAELSHAKRTDPKIGEWLDIIEASKDLEAPLELANIREIRRSYDRSCKLPARLVEELARITTQAQGAWSEARSKDEFSAFEPWLKQIVTLKREEAEAVGYEDHPYDALLTEYEPGAKSTEIRSLFAKLANELSPLIQQVAASTKRPNRGILERDFPIDRQRWFAESAAMAIGYDFQGGRLDATTHPFCTGIGPGDVRITTRYNPKFFNEAFFGVLHEAGHGIYEQGLQPQHFGTPAGSACSLGIHESQSRLWENQVGRSDAFWQHFFPRLQQAFPGTLDDVNREEFVFAINEVKQSFIRVEADEATYNLHIILRFEIEQDLLTGSLQVQDVPTVWNERFKAMFGLDVPSNKLGCLQDIHWSMGGIGYFPTYTLGNLYSAQIIQQAEKELGNLQAQFASGDFLTLKSWLNKKIHLPGQLYRPNDLIMQVTGSGLDHQPFIKYLKAKVERMYAS
jgi:carboxypeptidase Taq